MLNFVLMLLLPLLMFCLSHTLSLSVSPLSSSLSPPFHFAYKPLANLFRSSLITIKSSDKHRCFTERAEHNNKPGAYQSGAFLGALYSIGVTKNYARQKRLARDKLSSLFVWNICDEKYDIGAKIL